MKHLRRSGMDHLAVRCSTGSVELSCVAIDTRL